MNKDGEINEPIKPDKPVSGEVNDTNKSPKKAGRPPGAKNKSKPKSAILKDHFPTGGLS